MDSLELPPSVRFPLDREMEGKLLLVLLLDRFHTNVPPLLKFNPFPSVSVACQAVPGSILPALDTAPLTLPNSS